LLIQLVSLKEKLLLNLYGTFLV